MSGFDICLHYGDVFNDYVKNPKQKGTNRMNIAALREMNDVLNAYKPFIRKAALVALLLQRIDGGLYRQWVRIERSVKDQRRLYYACKMNLRTYGIDEHQYKAIMYSIKKLRNRYEYVSTVVFNEYVKLTPLKEYEEVLQQSGTTLDEVLDKVLENNDDCSLTDPVFERFADDVIIHANSVEYLTRLQEYKDRKHAQGQQRKAEETQAKAELQYQLVTEKLTREANNIHQKLMKSFDGKCLLDADMLHRYRMHGVKFIKILVASKVKAGAKAKVFYINKSYQLSPTLGTHTMIFNANDAIPKSVQKMIDDNVIVVQEIIIPA